MNYYKVLQVSEEAEPEVIEAAYRRLSQKYHPDVNRSPEAETRMRELNEAYQVLRDPHKRHNYDISLSHQAASNVPQKTTNNRNQPVNNSGSDWFNTIMTVASAVNESFATPCPNCGTKSLIHQKKLDKSVFDFFSGSQKYQCRNCGYVYKV